MPTVEFLNLIDLYVILDDGRKIPINAFMDPDGEDTASLEEAAIILAGNDQVGWFVIPLFDIYEVQWN
jgi:hypothetical protein